MPLSQVGQEKQRISVFGEVPSCDVTILSFSRMLCTSSVLGYPYSPYPHLGSIDLAYSRPPHDLDLVLVKAAAPLPASHFSLSRECSIRTGLSLRSASFQFWLRDLE